MRLFTLTLVTLLSMTAAMGQVMMTEIMYNPPEGGQDMHEFIELYNNSGAAVDMTGYSFVAGVDYTFESFTLGAGEYVLIAVNSDVLLADFGVSSFQWTSGSLSNGGELIQLVDATEALVDEVEYDDSGDWSNLADGPGASLVLCDFTADNNVGTNWAAANTATGFIVDNKEAYATPGSSVACPSGALIKFVDTELDVDEDAGTASFRIAISGADISSATPTTIDIMAMGSSSASVPADATFMPTSATFTVGEAVDTVSVTITIVDDVEVESVEDLILGLVNPTNDATVLGVRSQAVLTIADNDSDVANIVINEIMYNPPGDDAMYEYLELYNNGAAAVDMENYYFEAGVDFVFPAVTMMPGEFIIVAVDAVIFEETYGSPALQWASGALGNGGEVIELRDALGNIVDVVEYDDGGDWPADADGNGNSLILCDPSSDNSLAASWIAATQSFDIVVGGLEVFGSPGAVNDCTPAEPSEYVVYPIGQINTVNADGIVDSLARKVEITGIVHGVNLQSAGLLFTVIDGQNDGIAVFNFTDDYGYVVNEGDEITVQGSVSQYNGLAQIATDSVWMMSAGNTLQDVLTVNTLDESTESQLVQLEGVVITNSVVAGGGLNVTIENGSSESFVVRVDFDTNIDEAFINGLGSQLLRITGIGGQFDSSVPHDEGYQLLPRYQTDIEVIVGVNEPVWASSIRLFPVPVNDQLKVELGIEANEIMVSNSLGQVISHVQVDANQFELDASNWPKGVYYLEIFSQNERAVRRFVKQ